jgi:hypothetical protein
MFWLLLMSALSTAHAANEWKDLQGSYTLVAERSDSRCLPDAALDLRVSDDDSLVGTFAHWTSTGRNEIPVTFYSIDRGPQFYLIRPGDSPLRSWGWTLSRWDGRKLETTDTGFGGEGFPIRLGAVDFQIDVVDSSTVVYHGQGPAGRVRHQGCVFRRAG